MQLLATVEESARYQLHMWLRRCLLWACACCMYCVHTHAPLLRTTDGAVSKVASAYPIHRDKLVLETKQRYPAAPGYLNRGFLAFPCLEREEAVCTYIHVRGSSWGSNSQVGMHTSLRLASSCTTSPQASCRKYIALLALLLPSVTALACTRSSASAPAPRYRGTASRHRQSRLSIGVLAIAVGS